MSATTSTPSSAPRRLGAIVLVTVGVVLWGLISGLLAPQWSRLQELRQQGDVAARKLARLQRLAERKSGIDHAFETFEPFRSSESEALIQRQFLDELEQLSQAGNIQVNLKPRPSQQDQSTARVSVEIEVDATQDALLAFLDRLLAWPAAIQIERMRISSSPSRELPLRASLLVHKLVMRE